MESVRHRLNPRVHSYLIRGCSLALQVWLYECCSTVSTELAMRCSDSIPRILRWSANKGQIRLTAFEEKMIKPEWVKFTSMHESEEEIGVFTLPDKIQYEDEHGAQSSQVPIAGSPTFEPKHTDGQKDTESVLASSGSWKRGLRRKAVFEELSSLREFIDDSVKSVMKFKSGGDQVHASTSNTATVSPQHVDGKLDDSRKAVFEELSSLREFIDDSVKSVMKFKSGGDQVHASTSNTVAVSPKHVQAHVDLYPDFQGAAGADKAAEVSTEHLQAHVEEEPEFEEVAEVQQAEAEVSPESVPALVEEEPEFQEGAEVEKADIEDNIAQSPIHGVTVAARTEQMIENPVNESEDGEHVNEVVPEVSGIDKKGVTLDDFELPDNLTQLVMCGEPIPDEATPIHPIRTRQPWKHARSPFTPLYSSGGSSSVGRKFFYLKHPFTTVIGENVDADLIDRFTTWLYHRSDKVSKRRKEYFSKKDNQIKPWLDLGCENVDKKDWFYSLAHPGQVINNT
ncbi:PREDICTED: uncharacterized protein LOC109222603, partial [Nicotiana attenuata]|uniref:uncharacterized protein LOC109222603 n=1 Tax=Nicotiana attenuata TaxID=49451 RepID=UPI00090554EB